MKEVKMEMVSAFGNVNQQKNMKLQIIILKKQFILFGIVEGRDYVERGIFNTENVIKKGFE